MEHDQQASIRIEHRESRLNNPEVCQACGAVAMNASNVQPHTASPSGESKRKPRFFGRGPAISVTTPQLPDAENSMTAIDPAADKRETTSIVAEYGRKAIRSLLAPYIEWVRIQRITSRKAEGQRVVRLKKSGVPPELIELYSPSGHVFLEKTLERRGGEIAYVFVSAVGPSSPNAGKKGARRMRD